MGWTHHNRVERQLAQTGIRELAACKTLAASKLERLEGKIRAAGARFGPIDAARDPNRKR